MRASSTILVSDQEKKKKLIRIDADVHKALGDLIEHKGETYSDIIKRLIKFYKEQKRT
jgi:negative regulator of replication initiation